jgi:hypothetical protein
MTRDDLTSCQVYLTFGVTTLGLLAVRVLTRAPVDDVEIPLLFAGALSTFTALWRWPER